MIPRDHITGWRSHAPWVSDHQVEQDLVISRALVEIFGAASLGLHAAFRGGTALYKLYMTPSARYSEDIDLVQTAPGPIGDALDAIRSVLDPWLGRPRRLMKGSTVTLRYSFNSEDRPPRGMRLKIEINTREHFTELGHVQVPIVVDSEWWTGQSEVTTFTLDELLGTKLRALYQRRKGRDLFDLWYALEHGHASPERIVACFERCMTETGHRVTRAQLEENLAAKLGDKVFRADMAGLLRPGIAWDMDEAAGEVGRRLIARLPGKPWQPPP